MNRFEGKKALVTGASRGIGECVANRFAAEGASLYLAADGTQDELENVARECKAAGGRAAFGVFDLAEEGAAERMVEAASDAMGGVDILVNNAGIRASQPFGTFSYADFGRVVAVNLRAPFFASQAVLPLMREAGGGRIIHVASQLPHRACGASAPGFRSPRMREPMTKSAVPSRIGSTSAVISDGRSL